MAFQRDLLPLEQADGNGSKNSGGVFRGII
jgi:hypothetical protein